MNRSYESIKQGLDEAVAYAKGEKVKAIVHKFSGVDVKKVRSSVGLSQNEFASAFGISVSTLRHWERGDRTPQGPALVLLNVVAKDPDAVLKALGTSAAVKKLCHVYPRRHTGICAANIRNPPG